jgi:hypothetical protein
MNHHLDGSQTAFAPAHQAGLAQGQSRKGDASGTSEQWVEPLSIQDLAAIAGGWGAIDPV